VLRTFASTNGDLARTAKMVGIPAASVRSEMLALLDGEPATASAAAGPDDDDSAEPAARSSRKEPVRATPAKAKPAARKR
jgi:hypothetical protein